MPEVGGSDRDHNKEEAHILADPRSKKCIIPDCEEHVHYIHLGVCKACYAGLSTWRGRSGTDKRFRLGRIKRLHSRMEFILDNPKHAPKKKGR